MRLQRFPPSRRESFDPAAPGGRESLPGLGAGSLKTYTLYVHDSRYAVPTLLTIDAADDDRARAHATQHLGGSTHYKSVEVWDDERLVVRLEAGA